MAGEWTKIEVQIYKEYYSATERSNRVICRTEIQASVIQGEASQKTNINEYTWNLEKNGTDEPFPMQE